MVDPAPAVVDPAPVAEPAAAPAPPVDAAPRATPELASPPPVLGVDDKGFVLKSADETYALKLKGVVQFDGRKYVGDPALRDSDGFLVRKIRPTFEASFLKIADLRFVVDFAEAKVTVVDAYIDIKPKEWLKIRAGKFIAPVGLERAQQDTELAFMERSLTGNLTQTRDVGVVAYADFLGGALHGAAGVVDGAPDGATIDADTNQGKDLIGRIWFRPLRFGDLKQYGEVGIGVAGSFGDRKGQPVKDKTGLSPFRTSGQTSFFQYAWNDMDPTTGVYADGSLRRINPQLFYFNGSFGVLAEYSVSQVRVHRGDDVADLSHQGWHATANYVLGGKATLNGVTVDNRYDSAKDQLGAFEIAAQVAQVTLDADTFPTFSDPGKWARRATGIGAALSWYLSRNLRLSLNYDHTFFKAASQGADTYQRPDEKAVLARTQVLF